MSKIFTPVDKKLNFIYYFKVTVIQMIIFKIASNL